MPPETFTQSLWYAKAAAAPLFDPLEGERRADVAVIGAGILGLTAALHLAERGVKVAVIEATEPGFGASGRNGGLVVPHFPRLSPDAARRILGEERGTRLARMLGEGADLIFDLIRRHAIECDAVRRGWISPAHGPAALKMLESRAKQWQALGRDVRLLSRGETHRLTGAKRFAGALFDPAGGHLNPLSYVRGLSRAAALAGANIFVWSPVTRIARDGLGFRVSCASGAVMAERVLLCTNASSPELAPSVARSTIPLNVYQMATNALPEPRLKLVLPGDPSLSDTRFQLFSACRTPDRRIVSGGMAIWQGGAIDRLKPKVAARLTGEFDALGAVTMDYAWHGVARLTPDLLPRLYEPEPGVIAPIACNGRGLCMTTALGKALAEYLVSGDPAALPLPLIAPQPIAFHALMKHAPAAMLPFGIWRDRRSQLA
jgi:glycine/D-amino acid oxidase-like deaminating enzyme